MKPLLTNNKNAAGSQPADSRTAKTLREAARLVESGLPDRALAVVNRSNVNTDEIRNARGVCLLRLGRHEDALNVFRGLVLSPGSTWMKPDLPVVYCTNFCMALLLSGHPAGCESALKEIGDTSHPSVIKLRQTLARWEKGLSGRAWWLWKLGAEPDVPVTLDDAPGEFLHPPAAPETTPPTKHPTDQAA